MPDLTADPVATCLAQVRKEFDVFGEASALPRLLAALDAALALHRRQDRPVRSYGLAGRCGRHKAAGQPGYIRSRSPILSQCPDCRYTEYWVCTHCQCPDDGWPCPTYRAVSAALLGEESTNG